MADTLREMPRYIRQSLEQSAAGWLRSTGWQGADCPDGPWRPIPAPQNGTPWQPPEHQQPTDAAPDAAPAPADGPAVPEGREPAAVTHEASPATPPAPQPVATPGEEYHDDLGPVLWWRFPVEEPPYPGTPNDSDWPGYHTHFTPLPQTPCCPTTAPAGQEEN